jgi:uroporphyrinogen-III synthase
MERFGREKPRSPSGPHALPWACPGRALAGTLRSAATARDLVGPQATASSLGARSRLSCPHPTRCAFRTKPRGRSMLARSMSG